MTLLCAAGVHKAFGYENARRRRILCGASLAIAAGDRVAIVGASGSGKSTLLHVLGGLEAPDQGCVEFAGRSIYALRERELAAYRNETIGFVFQFYHLLPEFSAIENVMLPGMIAGESRTALQSRALALLDAVGLRERAAQCPQTMSGGEQQRVAVARAVLRRPKVVLADEPTGNLDSAGGAVVMDCLIDLCQREQAALVMVTHSDECSQRMQRVLTLRDGIVHEHTD